LNLIHEPFSLLKFNAEHACSKSNIKCFNFGLSDQNSESSFKSSKSNVPMILWSYTIKIFLIKLDIEGHELAALKEATNLVEKNNHVIFFE
jgi:hypothetical protein